MNQNSVGIFKKLLDLPELENHCNKYIHVTFKNILAPKGVPQSTQ